MVYFQFIRIWGFWVACIWLARFGWWTEMSSRCRSWSTTDVSPGKAKSLQLICKSLTGLYQGEQVFCRKSKSKSSSPRFEKVSKLRREGPHRPHLQLRWCSRPKSVQGKSSRLSITEKLRSRAQRLQRPGHTQLPHHTPNLFCTACLLSGHLRCLTSKALHFELFSINRLSTVDRTDSKKSRSNVLLAPT